MFDTASSSYILLNKILTLGQDEIWRLKAAKAVNLKKNERLLDVGTGTGDIAIKIARRFPDNQIYALDFSHRMLGYAEERAKRENLKNIIFQEVDCRCLPYDDEYFDYATISFAFRNLSFSKTNLSSAIKDIYRVLRKGGRLIILETSQPNNIFIRHPFYFYARRCVPALGAFFSGEKQPYEYLGNSIPKFLTAEALRDFLELEGFQQERITPFLCGIIKLAVFVKEDKR